MTDIADRSGSPTRIGLRIILGVAVLCAAGCGGSQNTTHSSSGSGAASESQVLNPGTVAITGAFGGGVVGISDNSVTLSGHRADLTPGKIVVSSIGDGFLRKVDSTAFIGPNTVVQTEPAGIPDAFQELHLKSGSFFNPQTIGNIVSTQPGLTFKWVPVSTSGAKRDLGWGLELDFGNVAISKSGGMDMSGTATFQSDPQFSFDFNRAPGDLLPSLADLNFSYTATLQGSLTIGSTNSGSIGGHVTFFDQYIGPPIRYGFLVFKPRLKVEAYVNGTAAGKIEHTQGLSLAASAGVGYQRGSGWTTNDQLTPALTAVETNVSDTFGITVQPLVVTLSFEAYGIVGPYASVNESIGASGTQKVQNSQEGVEAVVKGGVGGEIGVTAELPVGFSKFFGGSLTPVKLDFPIDMITLFDQFFPYKGIADIAVNDAGDPTDFEDQFLVTLDGTFLGTTDKGSTGSFHVDNLSPGTHTLTLYYTDGGDPEGSDPPGDLSVALGDGVTFSDGSTSLADATVPFDTSISYTVIVPKDQSPASAKKKGRSKK